MTKDGEVRVRFDGRPVAFGFGERDMLVPACAVTINKSQGSEYPAIVIPVMTQHYAILQRNLLGTGITRGKKLVVLTGQRKAIAIAVRNASGRSRWSKLREWLAGARRPLIPVTRAGCMGRSDGLLGGAATQRRCWERVDSVSWLRVR